MTVPTDPPAAGDPRYDGFRIQALWAWTFIAPNDDQEGIVTVPSPVGVIPAVGSDRVRIDSLRPYAQQVARALGAPVRLRRFVPADPDPLDEVSP